MVKIPRLERDMCTDRKDFITVITSILSSTWSATYNDKMLALSMTVYIFKHFISYLEISLL